jgi:filamin
VYLFIYLLSHTAVGKIQDGDETQVLDLVWQLVKHYQLTVSPDGSKALLLGWLRSCLPEKQIDNLTTNWRDGSLLSSLVNFCDSGLIIDHLWLDSDEALENVETAIQLAEEHFGIPRLLKPEDFVCEKPDENCIMTYLSYFYNGLESPGQKMLLEWIQDQTNDHSIADFADSWIDGKKLALLMQVTSTTGSDKDSQIEDAGSNLEVCKKLMEYADHSLGIDMTISPKEFSDRTLNPVLRMVYLLQFYFSNRHAKVLDLNIPDEPGVGATVWLDISLQEDSTKPVEASIRGKLTGDVPVEVNSTGGGNYRIQFDAEIADVYSMSVSVGSMRVKGSPFPVDMTPPDPLVISLTDSTIPIKAGFPVILTLSAKTPARGKMTADTIGEESGEVPTLVEKVSQSRYKVSFIPTQSDSYNVDIRLDGRHVKGSPFSFPLNDLIQPEEIRVGKPVKGLLGTPVIIPIDISAAGKDRLIAKCEGEAAGEMEVAYNPPDNPTEISFTPSVEDTYQVSIRYGSTEILDSPLKIKISDEPPDSTRVRLTHPPSGSMNIGTKIKIGFDATDAGCGNMSATCTGANCGDVMINVVETSDQEYELTFSPPESDIYTIDVLWSGKAVPGSPFNLNLIPKHTPNAAKCKVIGFPQSSDVVLTNEEVRFKVDATAAGTGYLDVVVQVHNREVEDDRLSMVSVGTRGSEITNMELEHESEEDLPPITEENEDQGGSRNDEVNRDEVGQQDGATAVTIQAGEKTKEEEEEEDTSELHPIAQLNIEPTEANPQIYDVTYVPVQGGNHSMSIYWSDVHITGSPMSVAVYDPQMVRYNEPISLRIKTIFKRKNLKVKLQKRDGTILKYHVKMEKIATGDYVLIFTPTQPDIYLMHIKAKGKPIKSSPFVINYFLPELPDEKLADVKVTLPTDAILVGEPVTLLVDVPDRKLMDEITMTRSRQGEQLPAITLEKKKTGPVVATFTPSNVGGEEIEVNIRDRPVHGSPFHISVEEKEIVAAKSIWGISLDEEQFLVGTPNKLKVYCGDLGEGELLVLCKPTTHADIEVEKDPSEEDVYWVTLSPKKAGKTNLILRFGGSDVEGSPFTLNFLPRGNAKKCTLLVTSDCPRDVNSEEKTFCVSTKGAGKGKITAFARSIADDSLMDVKVELHSKHHHHVSFVPTAGLNYMLTVRFDDVDINGSPYKILLGSPAHCKAEGEALVKLWTGWENEFFVDAVNAGPGGLEVAINRDEEDNVVEPHISKIEDFKYKVSCIPSVPGVYWVTVKWYKTNIPGSPFNVICRRPLSASQLSIVEPVPITYLGKPAEMVVEVDEPIVEDDKITAFVRSADGEKHDGEVRRRDDRSYTFSIQPPQLGKYSVFVLWDKQDIRGSPLDISSVSPPSASDFTMEAVEGEMGVLILSVTGPELAFHYGDLSASAVSAAFGEAPVQINHVSNVVNAVHFKPPQGGEYQLNILYDDKHIQGSPFKLTSTDASQCYLNGKGLASACINLPNKFSIFTENAGPGELRVEIETEVDNKGRVKLIPDITPRGNTAYDVSYTPKFTGHYSITVFWDDIQVPGSPFHIICCDPTRYSVSNPPKEAALGTPFKFGVKEATMGPTYEELTLFARDKDHTHHQGEISNGKDGNYLCMVEPPALGKYVVHVQCNGYDVSGSPFKFRNLPAPVAEKVVISGPGIVDGIVGEKGDFEIDVTEAGHGYINLKVQGPKSGFNVNLTDSKESRKRILAEYNPTHTGKYYISILWSGKHIPNSPFSVDITEDNTQGAAREMGVTMQSVR